MRLRIPSGMRRQTLLVLLALPIILLSETLSYRSIRGYELQDAEAVRTRQFLFPWTNLLIDIRRAESAQRGFLLTRRTEYLRPYREVVPRIPGELLDVERLSLPAPQQQARLKEVRGLIEAKLRELQRMIDLSNANQNDAALALLSDDRGEETMNRISSLMLEIRSSERAVLALQNAGAQRAARKTFLVSTVGDLVLLLVLAFAGLRIDRESRRRALDQESIRVLNEQLSRELTERTNILESVQDGFCAFNGEAGLIYGNPAAQRILGAGRDQLIGKAAFEVLGASNAPAIARVLESLPGERSSITAEEFIPRYAKWFHLRFFPAVNAGFTVYFSDVTEERNAEGERRRLQAEVEEARVFLDTFFENAPVGFGVWDRGLRCLRVNRALAASNGFPAAEHIGKTLDEILPRMQPEIAESFRKVVHEGVSAIGTEVTGMTAAMPGKLRTWIINYYPIRINDQIVGAGGIWEEITERKAIEESMRQSAKLESLGVLAGGIAHDFNNLLTGILGNASLAAELIPQENPARGTLGDVVAASERAAHLTRQLLAYAGKGRFVMEPLDLSDLVEKIGSLVRMSIPRNAQLRFAMTPHLPYVLGDISQLQQLVMNLVINGAEAIPEGENGSVVISTGLHEIDENYIRQTLKGGEIQPGKYVYLEVYDTGSGMDEATLARIFDPFFTTKFTGRGLGLAAVLGIVRGHKGSLNVYSTPGLGTTFKVLLPTTESAPVVAEAPEPPVVLTGSATILVIDDEEIVRRTTKASLESYGYTVVLAENGREGVDLLRELGENVSLVLLDLTMPVMSGEETLRQIHSFLPQIKVVLSSGFNEVSAVQRFTGKALAGFLQKPYTTRKLAELVQQVLGGTNFSGNSE